MKPLSGPKRFVISTAVTFGLLIGLYFLVDHQRRFFAGLALIAAACTAMGLIIAAVEQLADWMGIRHHASRWGFVTGLAATVSVIGFDQHWTALWETTVYVWMWSNLFYVGPVMRHYSWTRRTLVYLGLIDGDEEDEPIQLSLLDHDARQPVA